MEKFSSLLALQDVTWTQTTGNILSCRFFKCFGMVDGKKQVASQTTIFGNNDNVLLWFRFFRWYSTAKLELRSFLFIQPYTNSWGEGAEGNPHKCMDWVVKLTVHEGLLIGIGDGGGSHLPPNYPVWKGVDDVAISQLPRNLRLCKGPSSDTSDSFWNFIFNGSRTMLCKLKSSRCFCNSYFFQIGSLYFFQS